MAEVEGGLYHVITRDNNHRQIFSAPADYDKFLSLLALQKAVTTRMRALRQFALVIKMTSRISTPRVKANSLPSRDQLLE